MRIADVLRELLNDWRVRMCIRAAAAVALVTAYGIWTEKAHRKSLDDYEFDFHRVYNSAVRFREGHNPYEAALAFPRGLWAGNPGSQDETLAYPPLVPALTVPLTHLSWNAGSRFWTWLNIALLALAIELSCEAADPDAWWAAPLLMIAALLMWTVREEFALGNTEVLLLACYAAAARALRAGRQGLAGMAIGFAAAVKIVPLFVLLGLAITGRRRAVVFALVTAVTLTVGACLYLGPGTFGLFLEAYSFKVHPAFLATPANQSMYGFFLRAWTQGKANAAYRCFCGDHPVLAATTIALGVCAVMTAYVSTEWRRRANPSPTAFGWSIATLLMVIPFAFFDYVTELFVALAVLLAAGAALPGKRRVALLAVGLAGVYLIGLRDSGGFKEGLRVFSDPFSSCWLNNIWITRVWLGTVVIWGCLWYLRAREGAVTQPASPCPVDGPPAAERLTGPA